jgi:transcriptional regulator with XRE-family HTH domain
LSTIGQRLKKLRALTGKSQDNLSKLFGSNQSTLNRYENEQSEAPYRVLLWYADYFDVSMDYIYCRTGNPQGKLYAYQPDALKKKVSNPAEFEQFIEACFEDGSPLNARLKELLIKMAGGEAE